jgi:hypothetical protein
VALVAALAHDKIRLAAAEPARMVAVLSLAMQVAMASPSPCPPRPTNYPATSVGQPCVPRLRPDELAVLRRILAKAAPDRRAYIRFAIVRGYSFGNDTTYFRRFLVLDAYDEKSEVDSGAGIIALPILNEGQTNQEFNAANGSVFSTNDH